VSLTQVFFKIPFYGILWGCTHVLCGSPTVLPLRNLTTTVAKAVGIPDEHLSTFKVTCWEDNAAAETLANLDPGQSTPRSKFYDVKVHWFRSLLSKDIQVKRIDTKEQLAGIFTKPLPEEPFQRLRKKILGW